MKQCYDAGRNFQTPRAQENYFGVAVDVYELDYLHDGQSINEVNLDNGAKDGKYTVKGASIMATISEANGVIYVIDAVLLPPASK